MSGPGVQPIPVFPPTDNTTGGTGKEGGDGGTQTVPAFKTTLPVQYSAEELKKRPWSDDIDWQLGMVPFSKGQKDAGVDIFGYNAQHLWGRIAQKSSDVGILDVRDVANEQLVGAVHILMPDTQDVDILGKVFDKNKSILTSLADKSMIVVHCEQGKNRSPIAALLLAQWSISKDRTKLSNVPQQIVLLKGGLAAYKAYIVGKQEGSPNCQTYLEPFKG